MVKAGTEESDKNYQSVTELTANIKNTLEGNFRNIRVKGEISNYKPHSSGHKYFTIKDSSAQISCVMWKTRHVDFKVEDGMEVIITGQITVYPPRGNYQIDCFSIERLGLGDLYLKFEELKKQLFNEGLFDAEKKIPLPLLPMRIGVATSPTGAAVKDIFSTLARRLPLAEIYFRPTIVQGVSAENDIVEALCELNNQKVDLIIFGRGGGSIEDLWCFNTEKVAYAIYNSKIPIISAVGHETDYTIADYVADMRAATPTAAAELASPITIDELKTATKNFFKEMKNNISERIKENKELISDLINLDSSRRLTDTIRLYHQKIDEAEIRSLHSISSKISKSKDILERIDGHRKSLHPLAPLNKGFALLKIGDNIIKSDVSLATFKNIDILRQDETARVKVVSVNPKPIFK